MFRTIPRFTRLFDTPGDAGGGAGAPAPSSTPPAGATPPAAAPASPAPSGGAAPPSATPPGSGTPPPSSAGSPGAAPRFEYPEDRSAWIPPHRLSEIAQRAQRAEAEARRYRAMIEAGTGVNIREPERVDPAIAEARQAFETVFPGAGNLFDKMPVLLKIAEALEQGGIDPSAFARLGDVFSATEHQWQQHGRQHLSSIYTEVAKDYGLEKLSPRQQRVVGNAFQDWLEEDQTRVSRYVQSDPSLIGEFLTEYRTGFVDPLRRSADAATLAAGSRVGTLPPAPRQGGTVPPPAPRAPLTADEVHDRAFAAFQAAGGGGR